MEPLNNFYKTPGTSMEEQSNRAAFLFENHLSETFKFGSEALNELSKFI